MGNYPDEKIYVFQKVKIKKYSAVYSRKFYLKKDSNFTMSGSEDFKEDVIFKVEEIEKNHNNRISLLTISLPKIEFSSNLPKDNLVYK